MNKQLLMAINQICAERSLKPQVVIDAVEQALVSAYKRNFGSGGNVEAKLDPETGDMRIYARFEVVEAEEIIDPKTQLTPIQAAEIDPAYATAGAEVLIERTPDDFGRIAAQTAKQVILQRIREAERDGLGQSAGGKHVAQRAVGGQVRRDRGAMRDYSWHFGWNAVIAINPGDFLGEVLPDCDIEPVARRGDPKRAAPFGKLHVEFESAKYTRHFLIRNLR